VLVSPSTSDPEAPAISPPGAGAFCCEGEALATCGFADVAVDAPKERGGDGI
jgi:hypothetical protein